jgi:uncharacterized protein (TIGR02118 family)
MARLIVKIHFAFIERLGYVATVLEIGIFEGTLRCITGKSPLIYPKNSSILYLTGKSPLIHYSIKQRHRTVPVFLPPEYCRRVILYKEQVVTYNEYVIFFRRGKKMAKLIVIYDQPKDQAGFEKYYNEVHIPLVQKVPNLKAAEVHRVLQSMYTNEKLYLIAELHFENPEVLAQALATPEFQEVQGDVKNLVTYLNKPPVVAIVD